MSLGNEHKKSFELWYVIRMMPIEISNCCQCESQVSGQSAKNSASDKPDPLIMFILFLSAADDF